MYNVDCLITAWEQPSLSQGATQEAKMSFQTETCEH